MAIASINPATGETLRVFSPLTDKQVNEKLSHAASAFESYRRTNFETRAELLRAASRLLSAEQDSFARTITLEMGKPIRAARDEIAKCASACLHYATSGQELLEAK